LRAGLPSLIVPFLADQFFWGRQVYERGLGPPPIERTHLSAEALAQAITTMVTDQAMRQRAATVGEHIRAEDGVGNVVRLVERYLAGSCRTPLAQAGSKRHLSPIASGRRASEPHPRSMPLRVGQRDPERDPAGTTVQEETK
jgi:hypothetical protein